MSQTQWFRSDEGHATGHPHGPPTGPAPAAAPAPPYSGGPGAPRAAGATREEGSRTGPRAVPDQPRYPLPLKRHKKKSQLQIELRLPWVEDGKPRAGCVYLEVANALDEQGTKMDWANALKMKLGENDIAAIVMGMRGNRLPIDLVHRPKGSSRTSSLKIEAGQPGTYKVSVFMSEAQNRQNRMIYLNVEDIYLVLQYLERALPFIWNF